MEKILLRASLAEYIQSTGGHEGGDYCGIGQVFPAMSDRGLFQVFGGIKMRSKDPSGTDAHSHIGEGNRR